MRNLISGGTNRKHATISRYNIFLTRLFGPIAAICKSLFPFGRQITINFCRLERSKSSKTFQKLVAGIQNTLYKVLAEYIEYWFLLRQDYWKQSARFLFKTYVIKWIMNYQCVVANWIFENFSDVVLPESARKMLLRKWANPPWEASKPTIVEIENMTLKTLLPLSKIQKELRRLSKSAERVSYLQSTRQQEYQRKYLGGSLYPLTFSETN